jgi:hypothetical protein
MAIDTVRINGFAASWGATELKFAGERFHKFTAIDYGDKRTRTLVYGADKSQAPIGRSSGKYEPGVLKISGPKFAIQELRAWFATQAPDGKSYGNAIIPKVTLQFIQSDTVITVEFDDVTWESSANGHSESADALATDVELQPTRVRENGLTLYDSSEATS